MVVPIMMAFLGQLCHTELIAKGHGLVFLSNLVREDLEFWKIILWRAHEGISLNLLTIQEPAHGYQVVACCFGLWKAFFILLGMALATTIASGGSGID